MTRTKSNEITHKKKAARGKKTRFFSLSKKPKLGEDNVKSGCEIGFWRACMAHCKLLFVFTFVYFGVGLFLFFFFYHFFFRFLMRSCDFNQSLKI